MIVKPAMTSAIVSSRTASLGGETSTPTSAVVTTARYTDSVHEACRISRKPTLPPASVASTARPTRSACRSRRWAGILVVCGHGRGRSPRAGARSRRAAAEHPDAGRADRRRLRELRQRQLLALRVHAHLRPHRARGGGGRRAGRGRRADQRLAQVHPRADRRPAGLLVEVRDARGDPEPAGGARAPGPGRALSLALAPSYAVLCAAQAATAAAPVRQARRRGRSSTWVLLPAALLAAGVAVLDLVPQGPRALALLATFGTPTLAAAGGLLQGSRRWWLWPPAAAGLWLTAWLASGLVRDAAGVALVAPAWSLRAGLVALAALDVVLVWATPSVREATTALETVSLPRAAGTPLPSLQQAAFGSAVMGWLDLLAPALLAAVVAGRRKLGAAAVTGAAAGAWGLLLFVSSEVAATVPVLAGLAFAAADARRGRLRHPLEPARARGGARLRRGGGA